jgi:hypothetical protein
VDLDLELAARGFLDVGDELHDVFSVEIRSGVRGRQIPFGLRQAGNVVARANAAARR